MEQLKRRRRRIEYLFIKGERKGPSTKQLIKKEPVLAGNRWEKENTPSRSTVDDLNSKNGDRKSFYGNASRRKELQRRDTVSGEPRRLYERYEDEGEEEEACPYCGSRSKKQRVEKALNSCKRHVQPTCSGDWKGTSRESTNSAASRLRGMLSFSWEEDYAITPVASDLHSVSGMDSNPIVVSDSSDDDNLPDYSVTTNAQRRTRPCKLESNCNTPKPLAGSPLEKVKTEQQPVAITPLSKDLQGLALFIPPGKDPQGLDVLEGFSTETSHLQQDCLASKMDVDQRPITSTTLGDNTQDLVVAESFPLPKELGPSTTGPLSKEMQQVLPSKPSGLHKGTVPVMGGHKHFTSCKSKPAFLTWTKADTECPWPYTYDLHLLMASRGRGLSTPTEGHVRLFTTHQRAMVGDFLGMTWSLHTLLSTCCYLRMVTTSGTMPTADILLQLWEILTSSNKCVSNKVANEVVEYISSVTLVHPPGRNQLIKAQYKELLVSLSRKQPLIDHLILLFRGCDWKVKLLSCLVGVMVDDYHSTTSAEHPASSRSRKQDCLFRSLFWKAGNVGVVTQPVRRLVDLTVDAYSNWTGTWDELEGLRIQLCNELLFLVYTECESIAEELILAAPSIPGNKLLDLLTSLLPFKLRNRVTDKVDVSTIPLDCATVKWLLLLDCLSFEAAHKASST